MIWISWTNKYYNRKKGWSLETVWKIDLNKVFVLSTAITKLDELSFYYIKMQALFQLCSYSGWDNKTNFSKTKQRWFKIRPNRIFNKSGHLKIVWKSSLQQQNSWVSLDIWMGLRTTLQSIYTTTKAGKNNAQNLLLKLDWKIFEGASCCCCCFFNDLAFLVLWRGRSWRARWRSRSSAQICKKLSIFVTLGKNCLKCYESEEI
jgi:hypothetical protein